MWFYWFFLLKVFFFYLKIKIEINELSDIKKVMYKDICVRFIISKKKNGVIFGLVFIYCIVF